VPLDASSGPDTGQGFFVQMNQELSITIPIQMIESRHVYTIMSMFDYSKAEVIGGLIIILAWCESQNSRKINGAMVRRILGEDCFYQALVEVDYITLENEVSYLGPATVNIERILGGGE
jgi:hypothetical protein